MAEKEKASRTQSPGSHWSGIGEKAAEVLNVRTEISRQRTPRSALVERIGRLLVQPRFFLALLAGHLVWILLNLPVYPWTPWDPYPFAFIAMVASLEAPFIALLVLMDQRRALRIDELREEVNLQVSLHVEHELTMVLRMLEELQQQLDVDTRQDPEHLDRMKRELDPRDLLENLRRDLRRVEGEDDPTAP